MLTLSERTRQGGKYVCIHALEFLSIVALAYLDDFGGCGGWGTRGVGGRWFCVSMMVTCRTLGSGEHDIWDEGTKNQTQKKSFFFGGSVEGRNSSYRDLLVSYFASSTNKHILSTFASG